MSVYLDHAATTPMRDSAIEVATSVMRNLGGNPSGAHSAAQSARVVIEDARDEVAFLLGAQAREIVFTAGGTEAANLAVFGAGSSGPELKGSVVCSAFEHHAVLAAVEQLNGSTFGVSPDGLVDLSALADQLTENTALVSVMTVNNEVGTIQDIDAVARTIENRAPRAKLHTDAVQAVGWVDVAQHCKSAHLLSVSAHKVGGPMGVGALVIREGTKVSSQIVGGGQERELRSGTQNVAGIAAFARALRETVDERKAIVDRVTLLRDRLIDGLLAACPTARATVPRENCVAGHAHITFADVDSESLLFLIDQNGVFASAGASCASGALQPSHVLLSLGLSEDEARNGLRLTLGRTTSKEDIDEALRVVPAAVEQLNSRRGNSGHRSAGQASSKTKDAGERRSA